MAEPQYPPPAYEDPNKTYTQKGLRSIKWSESRVHSTPGVEAEYIRGSNGKFRYEYKGKEIITTWKQMNDALAEVYKTLPPNTGWQSLSHAVAAKYLNIRTRIVQEWLACQPGYQRFASLSNISHSKAITSNRACQRLGIDLAFFGNQPSAPVNGPSYVGFFSCIDYFSKYAWLIPIRKEDQDTAIKCMKTVLDDIKKMTDGKARVNVVQCDQGASFGSGDQKSKFVQFCKDYYEDDKHPLRVQFSRAHTPSTNGLVERLNSTMKRSISSFTRSHHNGNLSNWPNYIKPVLDSYNAGFHRMLKGKTPLEVLKGDLTAEQKDNIVVHAEETNKRRFVSRIYSETRELKPGDPVRVSLRRVSEEIELGKEQGGQAGLLRQRKDVAHAKGKPDVSEWSVKNKSLKKSILQTFSDRVYHIKAKVGRTYRLVERPGAYDRADLQSAPTLDTEKWNSDSWVGQPIRYKKRKAREADDDTEEIDEETTTKKKRG